MAVLLTGSMFYLVTKASVKNTTSLLYLAALASITFAPS